MTSWHKKTDHPDVITRTGATRAYIGRMESLPDKLPERQALLSKQDVLGASRLVIQSVIGVTDVVEAMHSSISRVAPPLGRSPSRRARGLSGQIYSSVRGVTRIVGFSLEAAHRLLPEIRLKSSQHLARETLVARINGVFGDHLYASENPLAIPMTLRRDGQTVFARNHSNAFLPHNPRPVILIHGLCMNDLHWQVDGHDHGARLAQELGVAPLYLHYNTGRRISTNGRDLALLLQSLVDDWPCAIEELVLIGHSMGGLVIRSACHYAQELGHDWPEHLRTAVFLGSPHHGAPLERIGNLAGRLLEASPYSAPIARLGRLRSAGIQDLRHGNLIDSDWNQTHTTEFGDHRAPAVLPKHVNAHAIAASLSQDASLPIGKLRGDGLVPVPSALGHHPKADKLLDLPEQNQHLIPNTNHIELLSSPTVYQTLRNCFKPNQ